MFSQEAGLWVPRMPYMGVGKIFYVDATNGADNHHGRTPNQAFQTIQAAYNACTTEKDDTIVIIDYEYGTTVDTFPINLNKRKVHIVGSGPLSIHSQQHLIHLDGVDNEVFQIGEDSFGGSISNLALAASGGGKPCIQLIGYKCWFLIDHIIFADAGVGAQDGILADASGRDLGFSTVQYCLFGRSLSRDGVRAYGAGNLTRCFFMYNIFRMRNAEGICIHHWNPSPEGEGGGIIGNRFYKSSLGIGQAAGWAITIGSAAPGTGPYGYIIDDNHAMESDVAPQNNPYKDLSGGGVAGAAPNGWGVNYSGGVSTFPDVS